MAHYRVTMANGEQVSAETLRRLRAAVRKWIGTRSVLVVAELHDLPPRTLYRILDGRSVSLMTAARVVHQLGGAIEIRIDPHA